MPQRPRTDVPTSDNGREIKCSLTGESFPYERSSPSSRRRAVEAAQRSGASVIDANNSKAGRKLSLREHQLMLEGKFSPDQRSLMERILQDGESRSNKAEENQNEIRMAAELDNQKLWGKSKARQETRARLSQLADDRDAEIQAEAERKERESNPVWIRANENAELDIRIATRDGESDERIDELRARFDKLQTGELSGVDYWEIVSSEVSDGKSN
ncbi:MAG: hypothetical protein KDB27_28515 [Planctomycetales bacterium]|nr:hypothetical protein [Planctomycetales bacterium]